MQNKDITNIMTTIMGNLVPVCSREANPELWLIYEQMQLWAFQVQHQGPLAETNETAKAAQGVMEHLDELRNRKLAQEIKRVILRYTPQRPLLH